ncbi:uncharacterized protein [Solanum tuberosum]|uniref:uncharacterized protein n=1 Tax=Solanum tuberosum TaxID=4113 RepID=UPI00073A3575|nr:PREDICTED: uncharacterized protein LOC107059507 [Solanum tuberosum]
MPSEVEIVVEKDDDEIEVTGESKDATEKEAKITQKVVPMPRPPPRFPQRSMKKESNIKSVSVVTHIVERDLDVFIKERLGVDALASVMMIFEGDADLNTEQVEALVSMLKRFNRAIGWTIVDIIVIPPGICSHKIQLMPDHKPSIDNQRRLNPPTQEIVKKETIKWLDAEFIYPIADSSWVCPIQCVPSKSGITVVPNMTNELVQMRPVTRWRIFIAPEDQGKTTFTFLYGTFAFKQMLFGLCNAPATFLRCMISIFSDTVEETIEVFMDDLSVVGDPFDGCLDHLAEVLKRCEECNLVLNWEKSHFMVKEGIILGHRISKKGIEVDRANVEIIEKLPPPISVKGVRCFFGHASFYRRAFGELKEKLVSAPIIISPDWGKPFEVMCDASGVALGVVLG